MSYSVTAPTKLKAAIIPTLVDTITSQLGPELKSLHQLNPNIKRAFILNRFSESSYHEYGDARPLFFFGLGDCYLVDDLFSTVTFTVVGAKIKKKIAEMIELEKKESTGVYFKALQNIQIYEEGYELATPHSIAEIEEFHRFLLSDLDGFIRYVEEAHQLAKTALWPVRDMVPQDGWIEIPLDGSSYGGEGLIEIKRV